MRNLCEIIPDVANSPAAYAAEAKFCAAPDAKCFVGVSPLSPEQTQKMIDAAIDDRVFAIGVEQFKGQSYLQIDLGPDWTVYNTLRLGPDARLARVLNGPVFDGLKLFASFTTDQVAGVAIHTAVVSQNLARQFEDPTLEELQIYVPSAAIKRFLSADIPRTLTAILRCASQSVRC